MTNLIVRKYKPRDFMEIELVEREIEARKNQPVEQWAEINKRIGPAVTITDPDGKIVVCCGVHKMWEGTGEVWAVFSPLAKKYLKTFDTVQRVMEKFRKLGGYTRLQTTIVPDWEEAIRFDEKLGFKRECLMKKYGPNGVDQYLYALVE